MTDMKEVARAQSDATAMEAVRCMLVAFNELGTPATMLDMGCGNGHMVMAASCLGVRAIGVDIGAPRGGSTLYGGSQLIYGDFEQDEYPAGQGRSDLVICWEVAEHISANAGRRLTAKLVGATGAWLLFSAATPGQGGAGHVNEQTHQYWMNQLTALHYDVARTMKLRWLFSLVAPNAWWYGKNLLVFRRD